MTYGTTAEAANLSSNPFLIKEGKARGSTHMHRKHTRGGFQVIALRAQEQRGRGHAGRWKWSRLRLEALTRKAQRGEHHADGIG